MAYQDNIQEILLRVKAEGRGEMDAYVQGLKELHHAYGEVLAKLAAGEMSGEAAAKGLQKITNAANLVTKEINGLDSEWSRLQESLKRMDGETAASAAESIRMRGQASREVVEGLHAQEQGNKLLAQSAREAADAENTRYQATLKAMGERGGEEKAQKERENADAVARGTAAVRDQMQAYDDMKAVQASLGAAESRRLENEQEVLRASAALRMQEVQDAVERAKQKDAAIERSFQIQTAAIRSTGVELDREMRRQGANSLLVQRGHDRMAESAKRFERQMQGGQEANNRFGYSILHVAHAFQDLQYGVGALLNNIPLVVQAFGGGPGMAGVIMTSAVAAEVLRPHLAGIAREFGLIEDRSKMATVEIAGATEKLDALTSKPWKTTFDYTQIREANEEIERMEKRVAAAKSAAGASTDIQTKVAKEVRDVVVEYAGATDEKSGFKNLVELIRQADLDKGTYYSQDPEYHKVQDMESIRARAQRRIDDPSTTRADRFISEQVVAVTTKKLVELFERIDARQRNRIGQEVVGSALAGEEKGIKELGRIHDRNRDLFRRGIPGRIAGVDPEFGTMLRQAMPDQVRAREEEEADEKRAEDRRESRKRVAQVVRQARVREGQELDRRLTIEQGVNVRAYDRAQALKGKMGAQVEEKPLPPFKRATSPWERNQQRRGRDVRAARETGGMGAIADIQAQEAMVLNAIAQQNGQVTAQQRMILVSLQQARMMIARQQAQMQGLRQQLPTLLRSPMPMMPR